MSGPPGDRVENVVDRKTRPGERTNEIVGSRCVLVGREPCSLRGSDERLDLVGRDVPGVHSVTFGRRVGHQGEGSYVGSEVGDREKDEPSCNRQLRLDRLRDLARCLEVLAGRRSRSMP